MEIPSKHFYRSRTGAGRAKCGHVIESTAEWMGEQRKEGRVSGCNCSGRKALCVLLQLQLADSVGLASFNSVTERTTQK